jgi:hypothetical protein
MGANHDIRRVTCGLLSVVLLASVAWAASTRSDQNPATLSLRWEEGQPGCTFSRDEDGKYRYGFWTADFGVVLAVDSQELEKARRRAQPILGLLLTVHFRGQDSLAVESGKITLEFIKHYRDVHAALDPDELAIREQRDADTLKEATEREIHKHPEKKDTKEATLAAQQKDAADMIEFLKTRSLRPLTLDPSHPEASGWVLFSSKSKWIDELQKQEEFVLRVPLGNRVVEFQFSLPPSEGDLILRHRPED